jgi:hypothetical protein
MFAVWLQTLPKWEQTTTPYLFLHTPDIAQAPELVDTLWAIANAVPSVGNAPLFHNNLLFSDIPLSSIEPPEKREFVWSARCMRFRCITAD